MEIIFIVSGVIAIASGLGFFYWIASKPGVSTPAPAGAQTTPAPATATTTGVATTGQAPPTPAVTTPARINATTIVINNKIKWYEAWKKTWWEENIIVILLWFALMHWALSLEFPDWYYANLSLMSFSSHPRIWGLQFIGVFFGLMMPKGKTPLHSRFGKWGLWVLVVFVALHLINGGPIRQTTGVPVPWKGGIYSQEPSLKYFPENSDPEVVKEVLDYFGDQPDMIMAAERETRFNHFKRGQDGKPTTEILRGLVDPDDTGVFQINRRIHAGLIREKNLDPDDLGANLMLAKELYDRGGDTGGFNPWKRKDGGVDKFDLRVLSTDEWTNVIRLPRNTAIQFYADKRVSIRVDGKEQEPLLVGLAEHRSVGRAYGLEFRALEQYGPTVVHFTYRYARLMADRRR